MQEGDVVEMQRAEEKRDALRAPLQQREAKGGDDASHRECGGIGELAAQCDRVEVGVGPGMHIGGAPGDVFQRHRTKRGVGGDDAPVNAFGEADAGGG